MSSREDILKSIREHTQTRYEMPDLDSHELMTYPDKSEQFGIMLKQVGGEAVVLEEGADK